MSDIKPWKTLQSDIVFEQSSMKIRKDICQLPEGIILQDYLVRVEEDVAIIFCVTKTGGIVFVRQFRQGTGEITLELPAGHRERHDINMAETARRELMEETGYSSDQLDELHVWSLRPSSSSAKVHLFFSSEAEKVAAPKYIVGETTEVTLKNPADVQMMLDKNEITSVLSIATLYRGLQHLRERKV